MKNRRGFLGKISLTGLFTGFSGSISNPVFNSIMIYGGAVGLFLTDVIPNLFNELSEEKSKSQLLVWIDNLKKAVAVVEGAALVGVIVDRGVELSGHTETAEEITARLVKAFVCILGAKGALMLLTAIENGIHEGVNVKILRLSIIQGGLSLLQSGFLLTASLGKLTLQAASGYSAPTALIQALDLCIAGAWHSCKASTEQSSTKYGILNNSA